LLWIGAWVAVATAQTEEPASQPVSRPVVRPPTSLPSTSPATAPSGPLPRVVLEIGQSGEDWGRIVIELAQDKVPITVDNFLQYVDDGFYDGTIFHRVIPGYLIQGGGYSSLTELKKTGLRRPIRSEAKNGLKNLRGTIAMARAKIPSSATAQFFINLEDNSNLDYPGRDGWGYCAFGTVVEGLEIVDRIKDVPAQRDPASDVDRTPSQPIDPPFIKRAYRLGAENTTRPAGIAPPERELPEPPAPGAEDSGHENTPEPPPPSGPPPKPETSEPART
jgi:cyclophilin family peptidyl-prolyl cis-trans isomerase